MQGFSIILPVRNGSNHVNDCIESILSQSYTDFELIVLENCSTDNTIEIIKSFKDIRIKVYPATKPLTMEENWQRAVGVPKREFMTLIGHDDMLDQGYLQTMKKLIEEHSAASLFQTHFRYIDANGEVIGKCTPMKETFYPVDLIHHFFYNKIDLMGTGFMMRSSDYNGLGGIPSYPGLLFADMQLFIALGTNSYLAVAENECFSYRKHPASTTSSSSNAKYVEAFGCLVDYLSELRKSSELNEAITKDSTELLRQYCQAISHRSLRTPKNQQVYTIDQIIMKFREFSQRLGNESFDPLKFKSIRIGRTIDNNSLLRTLFGLFKKIIRKPLLTS